MRPPRTVRSAESFGRVRLSHSFFMRDFLFSEIAAVHGFANLPDDPLARDRGGTGAVRRASGAAAGDLRAAGDPLLLPLARGECLRQRA
jgi:hypothetical protein